MRLIRFAIFFTGLVGMTASALPPETSKTISKIGTSQTSIDYLKREAIDQYEAKNYPEAEKSFYELISTNPKSSNASDATDYLQKIAVQGGYTDSALQNYDTLKKKGIIHEELVPDAGILSSIKALNEPGKLEEHLYTLFQLGGMLAARASLIGFVLEGMGFQHQATYYENQAKELAEKAQTVSDQDAREKLSVRPLHFIWPSFYEDQLELPKRFSGQFQVVTFNHAPPKVRASDQWYSTVNFGYFLKYVSEVPKGYAFSSSTGSDSKSDFANDTVLNVSSQKNMALPESFGWDYTLLGRRYLHGDFQNFNLLSHVGSVWYSFWNQKSYELRLRYDYALTMHRAGYSDLYHTTHGPQFLWSTLWNQKYLVDVSYSIKMNTAKSDPIDTPQQRSGIQHTLEGKLAYPGTDRSLQPYVLYSFDRNVVLRSVYDTIRHKIATGTAFLIGSTAALNFEASNRWGFYTSSPQIDQLRIFGLSLSIPLASDFFSLLLSTSYQTQTVDSPASAGPPSNFTRLDVGMGVNFGTRF